MIVDAIKEAELIISGEIRVHIEIHCKKDTLDWATEVFAALKMHETELRNGVLFYLAVKEQKFAILGDIGVNHVVEEGFWKSIKDAIVVDFEEGNIAKGLAKGILMAGEKLKYNFPYQEDDVNELPDEISFDNN
jgi:uncharacterized membrane protein